MKLYPRTVRVALYVFFLPLTFIYAAEPKVEEVVVGPANAGGVYTISQRGVNVAFASNQGSRLVVIANGIEGPRLDELFTPTGTSFFSPPTVSFGVATSGGMNANTVHAVIYSADGEHFAYAGRQGNEYVVILDGKEIGRGPRQALSLNYGKLTISPRGKFVYWGEMRQPTSGNASWRLVINGKPGPWSGHHNWEPVFSPDDTRYAYNAVSIESQEKRSLIVDGQVAGYFGHTPMFTADSKLLLTQASDVSVLVDGKPLNLSGIHIEKVTTAPVGRRHAIIMRRTLVNSQGVGILYLDGKEVPGTEGARSISFSPDGKRYALTCINPEARSAFMIIDGKKGAEYQTVGDGALVAWMPDSTKVVYTAMSGGRQFVVADGQEFAVQSLNMPGGTPFVVAEKGNRYAFSSYDGSNRNFLLYIDGQNVLAPGHWPDSATLQFSADGARYGYVVRPVGRNEISGVVLDGTLHDQLAVGAFNVAGAHVLNATSATRQDNPFFRFSPNGKHVARMARTPSNTHAGLYIDNKLAYPSQYQVSRPSFSPDSRHLFWLAHEKFPDRAPFYYVVYSDGRPVAKLDRDTFGAYPNAWEVDSDGVLTFLATKENNVVRYRVTPSAGHDIETMVARAEETQARLVAEAAAARKKADDDALAAKEKAQAEKLAAAEKAKADYAAAAAKRKADYDAAVAAKAKARQDAVEARQKAQADAAAARAAKQRK